MKLSKYILLVGCIFVTLSTFAQEKADKDKDLYDFAVPVVEVKADDKKSEDKEVKKEDIKKDEAKEIKDAELVADAQSLIRDKLIQKYQVRLDEVIDRLASKLGTVSVDAQKTALGNLRKTMSDRKTLVVDRKDLDPTKREIIIAILDHVIFRVDGLIKQSATQTDDQKVRA
jgi:predicted oxidoreductase